MAVYANDDHKLFVSAVESVYKNTLNPDQMVLVVDGPIPKSLSSSIYYLENKYAIDVLYLPVNLGLAGALNAGLKKVKTKWVLRADADDFNLPFRFSMQANIVNDSNDTIDLLGGAIREVDSSGNSLGFRRTAEFHEDILRYAVKRSPFNHMTVGYKKDLVVSCGGYPEISLKEDYALWASMLNSGAVCYNTPEVLVLATAGDDMYKRRGGISYAYAEIALQAHLVKNNLKNRPQALVDGVFRALVFLIPRHLRALIYKKILR